MGGDSKEHLPHLTERFLWYYSGHLVDFSSPYPGVPETLGVLSDYKKAVVSNKREGLSKKLLDALSLSEHFDVIMGSDSVDERKPSPKPLLHILERFSARPDEAVIVGDSNYDIEAGKAAGVMTIAATYAFRGVEFLLGADHYIDSFGELLQKLNYQEGR